MLKKFVLSAAILMTSIALFAQRPVITAVTDIEDNPTNGLEMCRSLFNEYFLSELTTHAKVSVLDTATTQKAITKLNISRGTKMTQEQISALCKELKADALCLVSMTRQDNSVDITVNLVQDNGKKLGTVKGVIKAIGETDSVSATIAIQAAKDLRTIRGIK